jgi:KR domain
VPTPGVLEDGRLAKQTAGSFRRVAAGKVAGVQALERKLSAAPTRGVIAFSSVSSIVAPLGQPNYASANASLCAWATAKAAQGDWKMLMPCSSGLRLNEHVLLLFREHMGPQHVTASQAGRRSACSGAPGRAAAWPSPTTCCPASSSRVRPSFCANYVTC